MGVFKLDLAKLRSKNHTRENFIFDLSFNFFIGFSFAVSFVYLPPSTSVWGSFENYLATFILQVVTIDH